MDRNEELNALARELPGAAIGWYRFRDGADVLCVAGRDRAMIYERILREKGLSVDGVLLEGGQDAGSVAFSEGKYDYVILMEVLEYPAEPAGLLEKAAAALKQDGRLIICVNNRMGVRYLCGDRDQYTERSFDGVEGYWRAYVKKEDTFRGRMYDRAELDRMLSACGMGKRQFYSMFPTLDAPTHIFREGYWPNEKLFDRIFPEYYYPEAVFLEQDRLYDDLAENGLLHTLANAYFIECAASQESRMSDVLSVTASLKRGRENATYTIIHGRDEEGVGVFLSEQAGRDMVFVPKSVEKAAAYPEGRRHIRELHQNTMELKARGVPVVETKLLDDICFMPYATAMSGQLYLEKLAEEGDTAGFWEALDRFMEAVRTSSEIYQGTYVPPLVKTARNEEEAKKIQQEFTVETQLFRHAFPDMVPLNSFYQDGSFRFFDQEFQLKDYPVKAVLCRVVATLYAWNAKLDAIIPAEQAYERYGLKEEHPLWYRMEWEFLDSLRNEEELSDYHKRVRASAEGISSNRQRMNYSAEKFQELFLDIFRNADTRKLILFGTGNFAKKFLDTYALDYPVYALVDNAKEHWGDEVRGIKVEPPDILKELSPGEYKVIICIKNYLSVMKQLDAMEVRAYSIFDPSHSYPRKAAAAIGRAHEMAGEGSAGGAGETAVGMEGGNGASAGKTFAGTGGNSAGSGRKEQRRKFHVGYISGVFDLFHKGHLNLIRRAKEQCDYLIVGVVSDEGVRKFKGTEAFIPFEERIEIIRACRYVDEAVEIPLEYRGIEDAYKMLHYDCQFCGSDYVNDPAFERGKRFLEDHGSELVILPYTESTSSTKLKAMIERRIL